MKTLNSQSQILDKGGRFLKNYLMIIPILFWITSCRDKTQIVDPNAGKTSESLSTYDVNYAIKWADMTLKTIKGTPGFSPPVASRALGYAGLTMYESSVYGTNTNQSLAGQINGLKSLSKPNSISRYNWALSLNAAQHQILKDLFVTTSDANKKLIDSLKNALESEIISKFKEDTATVSRSNKFGVTIAKEIFEYSKSDGGHEGYKRNFPSTYIVPKGMCYWEPTENGQKIPMQPFWGNNRTFLSANASIPLPEPKKASFNINSDFFKEYQAVYLKNKSLTQEEKEISVWWADDPSETFTPPGHSYSIAKIAIKTSGAKLDKAVEAFAKTGLAVADAFVLCWKSKYTYMNVRPYNYVRETIDPKWVPFWPAPPFPGFSSGHSTQSAAAAIALESVFGANFEFTDNSWEGRPKDAKRNVEFKPRKMKSFWAAAEESALSRFYGGIHTKMDNDLGLVHGKKIGQNVANIKFKK